MDNEPGKLIAALKQLPGATDPHLSKRAELRTMLRARATLDVQRESGNLVCVSALDVSDSGIGFFSRDPLPVREKVGIRMAFDHGSGFEPFEVRRGTSTVGGYKIGVVAC